MHDVQPDPDIAVDFLRRITPDLNGEAEKFARVVWDDQFRGGGRWVRPNEPERIAAYGKAMAEAKTNVWVSAALLDLETKTPGSRGTSDGAACVAALWADIDVAGPGHKGDRPLPPTMEDAMSVIEEAGVPPTLIVYSGHGIQVWWVLREPLRDMGVAVALEERLVAYLQQVASRRGWHVDSVADLARIMRLPGTVNWKVEDDPKLVTFDVVGGPIDVSVIEALRTVELGEPAKEGARKEGPREVHSQQDSDPLWEDARKALKRAGWSMVRGTPRQEYWQHPGATNDHSATWDGRTFYVFSGGGGKLKDNQGYSAGVTISLLGGDGQRTLTVTRASDIRPRPVRWLWEGRLAVGTLALLAGREGIGKSTTAYSIAARITRGTLPGQYGGQARAVIVAATEDSWEHTIVPRLMAADADLDLVLRVDVTTSEGVESSLSLPRDLHGLEAAIIEHEVVLVVLDPLMSRLDAGLDTHKDAEVRLALEPVVSIANRAGATTLGLIHVNKSFSTDPLTMIMGSRAFAAVARAVLFALADPDEEGLFHLGQPKNNLGRADLPTLDYRISSAIAAETDEGLVMTSRIDWVGQSDRSIRELLLSGAEDTNVRTATGEAAEWLADYLTSVGGVSASARIKEEGRRAGHSADALKRARQKLGIAAESSGFPRTTYWRLTYRPPGQSEQAAGETSLTTPTNTTGQSGQQSEQSGSVGAVGTVPPSPAPTVDEKEAALAPAHRGQKREPVSGEPRPCHRCGDLTDDRAGAHSVPCCARHGHRQGGRHDD